jgi:DNA-directed RNA polymerase specialized sigma24 family protein
VLVDRARERHGSAASERPGLAAESLQLGVPDESALLPVPVSRDGPDDLLLALDGALERLSSLDDRLCQVVECRFFAGLTEADTGVALGITERNVRREWARARTWLYTALREEGGQTEPPLPPR